MITSDKTMICRPYKRGLDISKIDLTLYLVFHGALGSDWLYPERATTATTASAARFVTCEA
jgi:hypothetical protein